ncbi:MAG: GNAT family N-acetyltransferase [Candidatus Nomurabacteria bacterium]|nr:MAG: GNAT family N-acetyltransferase [Candidatus Nomurabacteria bacterium]HRV76055.1 GNAT family N-acetyltransferase [Candidatus Saccharimonadales bacterium]
MNIKIEETTSLEGLYPLWQSALGDIWPLSERSFIGKLSNKNSTTLTAFDGDELVGMITINGANITVILVHPDSQRKGVGSALLDSAISKIKKSGQVKVMAGQGGGYFWPGVPTNLPGTLKFLECKGWASGELVTDMFCDLSRYSVPEDIEEKISSSNVQTRLSSPSDAEDILGFEKKYFPEWEGTSTKEVSNKNFDNIMLATEGSEIIGTNFLFSPKDKNYATHFPWTEILGDKTGGYGCLGVNEAFRGRYIGYKLAVYSERLLIERGCTASHLHWVFSIEWYERLGYKVWRQYQEMSLEI